MDWYCTCVPACVEVMALASELSPPCTSMKLMPGFSLMYTSIWSWEGNKSYQRPKPYRALNSQHCVRRLCLNRSQQSISTLKSLTGCMGRAWICSSYFPSVRFNSSSYVSSKVTFLWAATVTEVLNSSRVRPTELQKTKRWNSLTANSLRPVWNSHIN